MEAVLAVVLVLVALAAVVAVVVALAASRSRKGEGSAEIEQLRTQLELQSAELRRLADGQRAHERGEDRFKAGIEEARRAIGELSVREQERRVREDEWMEAVRRVDRVFAGGTAKGRAGENVLSEFFQDLPPDMLITDFQVNGKAVEFGLRLPDGRCFPVDSKWSAVAELEALEGADDPNERARLAKEVEKRVKERVEEVAQYFDQSLTAPVVVAAVPDPVYAVLRSVHAEALKRKVIIVSYSTALPVLLFLYGLVSRYGGTGDDLQTCLTEVGSLFQIHRNGPREQVRSKRHHAPERQ